MPSSWIDFKTLRNTLSFEAVLKFYRVDVKRKGSQHHGFCPLPNHVGQRNSQSFSANLERGVFQCFGCGAKGNLLDFAALMEAKDPKDGRALREVASKLQKELASGPELRESLRSEERDDKGKTSKISVKAINPPLDFELKGLDFDHPYLLGRGFRRETLVRFGLGFCSRGYLKNRIVIPLRDLFGRLVGYAGRVVDDSTVNGSNPRYLFPATRTRRDTVLEFRKSAIIYNGSNVNPLAQSLIVVEGFSSVWWLTQEGLPNVVATMGADCSEVQAKLICSLTDPSGQVFIISDGDKAGDRHAQSTLEQVARERFVRWIKLPNGKQPTDFSPAELGFK